MGQQFTMRLLKKILHFMFSCSELKLTEVVSGLYRGRLTESWNYHDKGDRETFRFFSMKFSIFI